MVLFKIDFDIWPEAVWTVGTFGNQNRQAGTAKKERNFKRCAKNEVKFMLGSEGPN